MNTPDQGIPQELLESMKCISIIPGEVKIALLHGGNYGRGLATCRTGHGCNKGHSSGGTRSWSDRIGIVRKPY